MMNPFKVFCVTAGLSFTVALMMKYSSAQLKVVRLVVYMV